MTLVMTLTITLAVLYGLAMLTFHPSAMMALALVVVIALVAIFSYRKP